MSLESDSDPGTSPATRSVESEQASVVVADTNGSQPTVPLPLDTADLGGSFPPPLSVSERFRTDGAPQTITREDFMRRLILTGLPEVVRLGSVTGHQGTDKTVNNLSDMVQDALDSDPEIVATVGKYQWGTHTLVDIIRRHPEPPKLAYRDSQGNLVVVVDSMEGGCSVAKLVLMQNFSVPLILKSPKAQTTDDRFRAANEFTCLRRMSGRGTPQAHAYDERDASILMDYMLAVSFASIIKARRGEPMSSEAVQRMAFGGAKILEVAHGEDIVHRDSSGNNYLFRHLQGKGVTTGLIDFGLARDKRNKGHMTQTGATLGTVGALSPEAIARGSSVQDFPSDINTLGQLLYHLRTGQHPFAELIDGQEDRQRHVKMGPASVENMQRLLDLKIPALCRVDPEFGLLLGEMMHTEEDKRPNARQVLTRLARMLFGEKYRDFRDVPEELYALQIQPPSVPADVFAYPSPYQYGIHTVDRSRDNDSGAVGRVSAQNMMRDIDALYPPPSGPVGARAYPLEPFPQTMAQPVQPVTGNMVVISELPPNGGAQHAPALSSRSPFWKNPLFWVAAAGTTLGAIGLSVVGVVQLAKKDDRPVDPPAPPDPPPSLVDNNKGKTEINGGNSDTKGNGKTKVPENVGPPRLKNLTFSEADGLVLLTQDGKEARRVGIDNWHSWSTPDSKGQPLIYALNCDGQNLKISDFQQLIKDLGSPHVFDRPDGCVFLFKHPTLQEFLLYLGGNTVIHVNQGPQPSTALIPGKALKGHERAGQILSYQRAEDFVRDVAGTIDYSGDVARPHGMTFINDNLTRIRGTIVLPSPVPNQSPMILGPQGQKKE